MSNASPFDTLKFSTLLREGGFTQQQADTLTKGLQEALTATVATKADLSEAEAALKADLSEAEAALKADLSEVRGELKSDISAFREDTAKGFQDVYKFMVASTLTIAGTIIGTAIALVRYLAP